ncbi:hypothetical protein Bhyg_06961 [Pseudolycoriella hygida]|uniref:Uncharacterized protein n=1 Tax=Pseudolycoriella hygida TaxID=35572 RepID=A0A9Q0S3H9_9DIPT|nr:hypothetical protein Bhyg_06961 [Pseudolycoriella hygida]
MTTDLLIRRVSRGTESTQRTRYKLDIVV